MSKPTWAELVRWRPRSAVENKTPAGVIAGAGVIGPPEHPLGLSCVCNAAFREQFQAFERMPPLGRYCVVGMGTRFFSAISKDLV
jgi:hypothetical protein